MTEHRLFNEICFEIVTEWFGLNLYCCEATDETKCEYWDIFFGINISKKNCRVN